MSEQTTLVATLTEMPTAETLRALAPVVDVLEVRADLLGDVDPAPLRDAFPGRLLYTLRSRAEGGAYESGRRQRRERIIAQAPAYDLIDLETARDLHREVLAAVPEAKRIVSWHGPAEHLSGLKERFAALATTPARFHKMIPTARRSGNDVDTMAVLRDWPRRDDDSQPVIFAGGPIGTWTRLVAPRLGSALTYAAVGSQPGAPGQLTLRRLVRDYGLPELRPATSLFGIVGNPVLHSLSPRLHNGAYREHGVGGLYVPFHVESFGDFWLDVVESGAFESLGLPLAGLSVTSPHKEVALAVSGVSSPRAQHISAANTLVLDADGVWEAETTDPEGVTGSLLEVLGDGDLQGRHAAVVGCGGAGKAAAYGLKLAGAEVTLVNRGEERGRRASDELSMPFVPLAVWDPGSAAIIVHATALGHGEDDPLPFAIEPVADDALVVDLVYHRWRPTRLLSELRERGVTGVDGRDVLLHQALGQYRLMTGKTFDPELARGLLDLGDEEAVV